RNQDGLGYRDAATGQTQLRLAVVSDALDLQLRVPAWRGTPGPKPLWRQLRTLFATHHPGDGALRAHADAVFSPALIQAAGVDAGGSSVVLRIDEVPIVDTLRQWLAAILTPSTSPSA